MISNYKETDKMADMISGEYYLLQMMSRFGIRLGVGERTIKEVCDEYNVDCQTFLTVANYIKNGESNLTGMAENISIPSLMTYLTQAHDYFLEFQLPSIRRKLIEAVDCSMKNEVAFLILKFYDAYMNEVRKHMQYENRKIFTYVEGLLNGVKNGHYEIATFARTHESIEKKLQELKNIIIKYYTPEGENNLLNAVLFDIFNCEVDLAAHCQVENVLFVPAVKALEEKIQTQSETIAPAEDNTDEKKGTLSEREREIVICVVKGMANKEIADKLCISINTVLTHRKNISRKLQIHSVSGLTIYAIVNKYVNIEEVQIA